MDVSVWVWAWTIFALLGLGAALQVLLLRLARGRMAMRTKPGELPWNGARQFLFAMLIAADAVLLIILVEAAVGGVWTVLNPPDSPLSHERVRLMAIGRTITIAVVLAYMVGLIVTWYTLDRLQDEDDEKRRKLQIAAAAAAALHPATSTYPNPYAAHPSGPLTPADIPAALEEDHTTELDMEDAHHDA